MVVADDDNLDIAESFGFVPLERPNDELGRKFNDGIEYAVKALDADLVAVVGSDDWVHEDLFDRLPLPVAPSPDWEMVEGPVVWREGAPEIITGRSLAFVDLRSGTLRRCQVAGTGAIPWIIPRAALEPSDCRPVNETQQRGIDFSLRTGLKVRPVWVDIDPHDLCRVDFKSATNLNAFDEITHTTGHAGDEDAWVALRERYPDDLVELAVATSDELRAVGV